MAVLVPVHGGWIDARIPEIARRLQDYDPDMEVRAHCGPRGNQVLHYEVVWRGEFVGRWAPHEVDRILHEVPTLDRRNTARPENIDRVESRDAERERDSTRHFEDAYREMLEHWARLVRDTTEGRHFFGQAGVDLKDD